MIAPLSTSVQEYLPAVTVVIGAALLGLGVWMPSGREITLMLPKPGRGAPTARLGSMFGYGLAYAIASLSCTIGPFLAVTAGTFRSGSVLDGVLAYFAYATGMALVVGVLAVATALASSTVARGARWLLPHINRISGVLLVVVGLYVSYYGLTSCGCTSVTVRRAIPWWTRQGRCRTPWPVGWIASGRCRYCWHWPCYWAGLCC